MNCDHLQLARARNQKDEERDLGSDEYIVSSENARNAAATAFNKENFNYLQGHVPSLDGEEEGRGAPVPCSELSRRQPARQKLRGPWWLLYNLVIRRLSNSYIVTINVINPNYFVVAFDF